MWRGCGRLHRAGSRPSGQPAAIARNPAIQRPGQRHCRRQPEQPACGPPDEAAGPPDGAAQEGGNSQRAGHRFTTRLAPLHRLLALRRRYPERVKIRHLPRLDPGRCTNPPLDETRARGAEGAVAVEQERAAHACNRARHRGLRRPASANRVSEPTHGGNLIEPGVVGWGQRHEKRFRSEKAQWQR
jgi:hypothetical protein